MRATVAKRNGGVEAFVPGRVALAIYKACQAQKPPREPGASRSLANKALLLLEKDLSLKGSEPAEVEWIQDRIVEALRSLGESALADSYQSYRKSREDERSAKEAVRKTEKRLRLDLGDGKCSLDSSEWERGVERALGPLAEKLPPATALERAEQSGRAKSYQGLAEFLIESMLAQSQGDEAWLAAAGEVFVDLWAMERLGKSWLREPAAAEDALREAGKTALLGWKDARRWFPSPKELAVICETFSLRETARIPLPGLQALKGREGGAGDFPDVRSAKIAIALAGAAAEGEGSKLEIALRILKASQKQDLIFPLGAGVGDKNGKGHWALEWSLGIEDTLDSIFEGLKDFAWLGKEGISVSADLSALRASGSPIGDGERRSAGIAPTLRLFGETCGMLDGGGETQKARLFLEPWHADLEDFLAFAKQAKKETRLCLALPDAFMKRALEGGEWILASPSDAPKLAQAGTDDFELWLNEAVRMAKFNALGSARCVPAREVFGWICETIASCGGPSIAFRDNLAIFGESPGKKALLSVKMGSALPSIPGEWGRSIECSIRCSATDSEETLASKIETGLAAADLASRLEEEKQSPGHKGKCERADRLRQIALCPIGDATPEQFGSGLELALSRRKKRGIWAKGSLWGTPKPWSERFAKMKRRRGGMASGEAWGGTIRQAPEFASIVAISPREEYLWLSGEPPCFVPKSAYRFQARQGKTTARFGGKDADGLSLRDQADHVACWQKVSDQGVTWDARLEKLDPSEIGEAISMAWLKGISGIRRFLER